MTSLNLPPKPPSPPPKRRVAGLTSLQLALALALTLTAGLVAGYFLRDRVSPAAPSPSPAAETVAGDAPSAPFSPSDATPASAMEFALSEARHFQGRPDAPVTIVEFSDFQ